MITGAIYIFTLVVWIFSMLLLLRFQQSCKDIANTRYPTVEDNDLPALTVIVTARNQEHELKRNLPLIINQIYPNFEVIVVDINSTDETKKLLEKMEEDNMMLRHTSTPATGRDISRQRLAITLGVKASANDWFVLTEASCCPISHLWLRRIGECIAGHRSAEMVLGYTRYKEASTYAAKRLSFHTLWKQLLNISQIIRGHSAYFAEATNLAYKKDLFLSHQGFASGSNLLEGATEIMVNQNSTYHNTALCLQPDAIIEQDTPRSPNHWRNKRLFFQESQRHFTHRWGFRLNNILLMGMHSLMAVLLLTTIILSIIKADYIVGAIALVLWLSHFAVQGIITNAVARKLNNQSASPFATAWFMHLLPVWSFNIWMQHAFADKNQFRKKYI